MRIEHTIRRSGNSPLILLFLGYSFTPDCIRHLASENYDLSVVYDYRNLDFDANFLEGRRIYLIAWSMGVWAANRVLKGIPLENAVAINGTPYGIHDSFGIPERVFRKTIDHFDFNLFKKWCFLSELPKADFRFSDDPLAELEVLYAAHGDPVADNVSWDKAIVSRKDLIFPPAASQCFRCPQKDLNAPHYPFFKFKNFEEILAL